MVTQSYKRCQLWTGSASGGMSHKLKKKTTRVITLLLLYNHFIFYEFVPVLFGEQ